MALVEQISLIKQGVKNWNSWRRKNSLIAIDLTNADLRGLDLSKALLWDANLERANLEDANLVKSDFRGANLRNTNLENANLSQADLRNANLTKANLTKTILDQVNLAGTLLIEATIYDTSFREANLTAACIQNWLINNKIVLDNVICNYVYLTANKLNRYPENGNFKPGEFTELLRKDFISETAKSETEDLLQIDIIDNKKSLEDIAFLMTTLINHAATNLPESPTRHVKIATQVVNLLKNNQGFLEEFNKIKAKNNLDVLEALVPHAATQLIIIALKK